MKLAGVKVVVVGMARSGVAAVELLREKGASVRAVDDTESVAGAPVLQCREAQAVVPGEPTVYRVPLVANARRFDVGHRLRLVVASDDQDTDVPAIMGFRHARVGTSSLNTIHTASRLVLPVTSGAGR